MQKESLLAMIIKVVAVFLLLMGICVVVGLWGYMVEKYSKKEMSSYVSQVYDSSKKKEKCEKSGGKWDKMLLNCPGCGAVYFCNCIISNERNRDGGILKHDMKFRLKKDDVCFPCEQDSDCGENECEMFENECEMDTASCVDGICCAGNYTYEFYDDGDEIYNCVNNECQILKDNTDVSKWQTYRNEEFGFEMKYPEEWKQCEGEDICFRKDISFDHPRKFTEINIKANQNNQNLSFDEIISDFENNGYVYEQKEYIILNDKEVFIATIANWGMVSARQFLIIGDNYWYDIIISGTDTRNVGIYQILSSFKFTEKDKI